MKERCMPLSLSHTSWMCLFPQASQLGVYKAFVDNYKVALETAEKCSQAHVQFQKISEVGPSAEDDQRLREGLCE